MIDLTNFSSLSIDGIELVSLSIDDVEVWRQSFGEMIDLESIGYHIDSKYSYNDGSLITSSNNVALNKIEVNRSNGEIIYFNIQCKKSAEYSNSGTFILFHDNEILSKFTMEYNFLSLSDNQKGVYVKYNIKKINNEDIVTLYLNFKDPSSSTSILPNGFAVSFSDNTIEDINISITRKSST